MTPRERGAKPRPKPAKPEPKKGEKGENREKKETEKTPDEVLAKKWGSVRRGLFLVQFSLLFVAFLGFVGFGKAVYERSVGPLPTDRDPGVVKIEGYINTAGQQAIDISKAEELDLLLYGLPVFAAGFFLTLGRLFSSGGPRNCGARGLFTLSGLLTLVAIIAVGASAVCWKMLWRDELYYALAALVVCPLLAEFWFLTGLTASGLALKRPSVARAVGFVGFAGFVGLVIAALVLVPALEKVAWTHYVEQTGRPKEKEPVRVVAPAPKEPPPKGKEPPPKGKEPLPVPPPAPVVAPKETDPALVERRMYEQAALMIGWLILVAAYSRAVRGVRVGARDFIRTVEDKDDEKTEGKDA